MCDPVTIGVGSLVLGGLGLGASVIQGQQAQSQAKKAAGQAEANAKNTATQADQAMNAANKKQPNVAGLTAANALQATGGQAGTMLTGPGGVANNDLALGKSTLLGA